jgi:4'-phosphopantetheinyl transferase
VIESVNWSRPGHTLTLPENEVHVWRTWLDVDAQECARLSSYLSEDEFLRANRFVFPRDRSHFMVARGRLRELLAMYLQCSPEGLQFRTGLYGKLSLPNRTDVRFNLTHSYGLALYGFAMQRELGIDAEKIRPEFASEEIAERYFSVAERRELRELPPELRTTAFFLCWTRKEAYVKAHGDGLQIPLASFDVSLTPGEPETLRSIDSERWSMRSFRPAPEYVAAILGEGRFQSIRFWSAGAHPVRKPAHNGV